MPTMTQELVIYNKGSLCPYEFIFYQEGFCHDCIIFLSEKLNT
jgi:hypothetical protein